MSLIFNLCRCEGSNFYRIPRSFWMRFFSARRLYQCSDCETRIFVTEKKMLALKNAAIAKALSVLPAAGNGSQQSA